MTHKVQAMSSKNSDFYHQEANNKEMNSWTKYNWNTADLALIYAVMTL